MTDEILSSSISINLTSCLDIGRLPSQATGSRANNIDRIGTVSSHKSTATGYKYYGHTNS